jgi:hypothetical protein
MLPRLPGPLPRQHPRIRTAAAALLAALALGACGAHGSSSVSPAASRTGPESIFESEPQLDSNPAQTLDLLRRLGVDRVKVYLPWEAIAPDPASRARPAGFDAANSAAYPAGAWAVYDTIVRDAQARGIALDMTIGGPAPLWATGPGVPPGTGQPFAAAWRPSASEYGAFVRAAGSRYGGAYTPPGSSSPLPRVSFWAIWNEPNYGSDLAPQAVDYSTVEVSPLLYRGLVDAAWTALQGTGHGADTILIGELAPRGETIGDQPGNFSGMVPLRFVRALYCVDSSFRALRGTAAALRGCPASGDPVAFRREHPALFAAGGFAVHPYPQGGEVPTAVAVDEPDYADLAALPNLERTLDRVQRDYGSSASLPIYSTEFGYQTDPPETIAHTTDPQTAAYYLNWSEYISWRDPRIRSFDQYQLVDPPNANALGGFATGLEFKNGNPKALYAAYRMPLYLPATVANQGQALEVWGCVRPAHYAQIDTGDPQRVRIEFRPSTGGSFNVLSTVSIADPHGYFDARVAFPTSGVVRLGWAYPRGPAIHSRVVAVTIR